MKGAPIGSALALPSNSKTCLERVSNDKQSSLLSLIVCDEGKKFYNIDTMYPLENTPSKVILKKSFQKIYSVIS
jgi:hypothetical protein